MSDHGRQVGFRDCATNGRLDLLDLLSQDKTFVVDLCSQNGYVALEFSSEDLRNDKEVVLAACSQDWDAFQLASKKLKDDKETVLTACSKSGFILQFASNTLRADKEVVMAAVTSTPESLKFALGGLSQDRDILIKAGLWDKNHSPRTKRKKIVLSTRFSLAAKSSLHATKFAVELKSHPYIAEQDFLVYFPNAFNKGSCDPNWTDNHWPCRGTFSSCQKPPHLKNGTPGDECCWRYSFRCHLADALKSGGFMIQVVDWDYKRRDYVLGNGQAIETQMA